MKRLMKMFAFSVIAVSALAFSSATMAVANIPWADQVSVGGNVTFAQEPPVGTKMNDKKMMPKDAHEKMKPAHPPVKGEKGKDTKLGACSGCACLGC